MKILYVTRHFNRSGYYILKQIIQDGFDIAGIVLDDTFSIYRQRLLRWFAILSYRFKCRYYRCSPIKFLHSEELLAAKQGIRSFKIKDINSEAFDSILKEIDPSIIVIGGGWPQLLSKNVFGYPIYGTLNTHPSLLPKFRGTTVHRWQIFYGAEVSGVTIHYVNERFDTGKIIAQTAVSLLPNDTPQTLSEKCARAGAPLMSDVLRRISVLPAGGRLNTISQDSTSEKYYSKWLWQDQRLLIEWQKPFKQIYNLIRAANQESYEYKGPIWQLGAGSFLVRKASLTLLSSEDRGKLPKNDEVVLLKSDRKGIHFGRRSDPHRLTFIQLQRYERYHRWRRGFEAAKLTENGMIKAGDHLFRDRSGSKF